VVTLPFVLLLLDYWPLHRFEQPGKLSRLILEKIPLLALAAGACAMTVLAAGKVVAAYDRVSMPSRLGNALVAYAVYLRQMVWPEGLAVFYPRPEKGYPVWTMALSFLLLGLITGGVLAFRRKRGWLLTGWLWYLGMLTPMIGVVQAGAFAHADRMTYLPQIGIYMALAWLMAEWRVRWLHHGPSRVALGGLMTAMLAVLMVCGWKQTAYWQDSETLWSHTLACTTSNYVADLHLGIALEQKGMLDEAAVHYQEALKIDPDKSPAHNNIAGFLVQKGRLDEAISQYQQALQIDPDFAEGHYNLGIALQEKGRVDEAISQYQHALKIKPDYEAAHYNLAIALQQKGRVDEAIAQFQNVLQINPDNADAHYNLATALRQQGKVDEAKVHYQWTLQIRPDYAEGLYNLGNALRQKGRLDDAITQYQEALQIKPDYADAQFNLGNALLQKGKADEAVAHFQRALETNPNNAGIRLNLGLCFYRLGRMDEAISQYEKALQIEPADSGVQNDLAWLLATCPQASLRNGARAVELARQANELAGGNNPIILATVAAAFAEAGRFSEAVETAQRALHLAEAQSNTGLAGQLQSEMKLYQAGSSFHSPAQTR
jgi:tetratricopeptide (TPR) repeat protein